jgi:hypothetical protein
VIHCDKCGLQIIDGISFCSQCGASLSEIIISDPHKSNIPMVTRSVHRFAIISLILSIISILPILLSIIIVIFDLNIGRGMSFSLFQVILIFLLFSFLSIFAIILGAISIKQTKNNSKHSGRGIAIAGLVMGIFSVYIWIIAAIIIFNF